MPPSAQSRPEREPRWKRMELRGAPDKPIGTERASSLHESGVHASPEAYIGAHAKLEPGCIIERGALVCSDAHIGAGARVGAESQAHAGATVGPKARIGPASVAYENSQLETNAELGHHSTLGPGAKVQEETIVGLGLIRFGGHLPRGEYDVDHDGHAGQADAAELHG